MKTGKRNLNPHLQDSRPPDSRQKNVNKFNFLSSSPPPLFKRGEGTRYMRNGGKVEWRVTQKKTESLFLASAQIEIRHTAPPAQPMYP